MMHRTLNSLINTINDNKFSFNYTTLLLIMSSDCCMPWHWEQCTMEAVDNGGRHGSLGVVCVFT
jgi:hypothetical protein